VLEVGAAIRVDGFLNESEWQEAMHCGDWRRIAPFALDAPIYGNELRILPTKQGLAAAFILDQPPSERRIRPRTPRDAENLVGDTVALMVDFDATGQVGYEFAIGLGGGVRDGLITNQNRFDRDWDGSWQHAVRETQDQWFVELLIPWTDIRLRDSQADTRDIAIYATRYLSERGERYACPGLDSESAVFLSDFKRIQVRRHEPANAGFDLVPYATVISDLLRDETDAKGGVDLSWNISPRLWLAATVNPDFGQIESDELVVNFTAIETVQTDKRPFFTQNHGVFDLRTPANGQLIYTRRIGASPDEGDGLSADIDGALRVSGSTGSLIYGAFVAQEEGYEHDEGRLFTALRLVLPLEQARLGYLATWTDRPALDRDALINAVDFELAPGEDWRIAGQLIRSDIGTAGLGGSSLSMSLAGAPRRSLVNTSGYEGWLQADFSQSASLRHTFKVLHIDERFDMNDLGYMERNALKQAEWDISRRVADPLSSAASGETQRLYAIYRENSLGQRLPPRLQISRDVQHANIWRVYQELRYIGSGVDDLLSRGNGPVRQDARLDAYADVTSPRLGDWQFTLGGYVFQQGVSDYSVRLQLLTVWYPTETLTLRLDLLPYYFGDWLLWENHNRFATYRGRRLDFDVRVDWIPKPRHELRIKWQWIGVDADPMRAYRSDPAGNLHALDSGGRAFTVNNLGLQIRYRYEIGRLSEMFLVYGRGGYEMLMDDSRDVSRLLRDMGTVRDSDQIMVKLRYRL